MAIGFSFSYFSIGVLLVMVLNFIDQTYAESNSLKEDSGKFLRRNLDDTEIPIHFDVRDKWIGCGLAVVDQGQCGDCWAASATSVFGDRLCIWFREDGAPLPAQSEIGGVSRLFQKAGSCTGDGTTHAAHNHGCKRTAYFVSPQALVSCGTAKEDEKLYPNSYGCQGGEAIDAWSFFHNTGLTTMTGDGNDGCTPYTAGKCSGKDPNGNGCRTCAGVIDQCVDTGLPPKFYKVASFGVIHDKELKPRYDTSKPRPATDREALDRQIKNIQKEIMTNGPVHSCVDIFTNFQPTFNAAPLTIYNLTEGPMSGGHCLNIIGWGHDSEANMDYWIVKNSWGDAWGSQGTFRYVKGVDLGGFESDVWAACPENPNCKLTDSVRVITPSFANAVEDPVESRKWRGGYWKMLKQQDYSTNAYLRLEIARAYEKTFGEPISIDGAIARVKEVWTQAGVKGMKVRVDFKTNLPEVIHSATLHHNPWGVSTLLHLEVKKAYSSMESSQ